MLKLIALTTLVLVLGAPTTRADSSEGNVRGQAVSECNHRANVQELKGQERKDFVDWCTSRDQAAAGDNPQPDRYGECYARMADSKLRGQHPRNCAGRTAYHMARS